MTDMEGNPQNAEARPPCKVFVVEDHEGLKRKIELLLEITGETTCVGSASNGEDALNGISRMDVDVVLLDLSLPVIGGIEVLKRVRESKPETRCLVISGYGQKEHVETAMNAGASGYILKGNPAEITRAICSVHEGRGYFSEGLAPD